MTPTERTILKNQFTIMSALARLLVLHRDVTLAGSELDDRRHATADALNRDVPGDRT